ncbi:hypothetical protein GRI97_11320 [Altererythrobacter xixiisoli]|uniref:Uncharacterized protein n=1 Tax=Croceibacterium xixiisoli TaxID=1476466 RepID=A0A6I4TXT1_9SPHN|nr:hypothetical protein [Croceibacterium xixiisoli]MXO99577.1 hypothetical protein [Croceibacterium xixiisoli]
MKMTLLAIAGLMLTALPAQAQDAAAPVSGPVSGRAAIDLVIGNSLVGTVEGQAESDPGVVFYLNADGTAKARSTTGDGETRPGQWSVGEGDTLCIVDPGDKPDSNDCMGVTVIGDQVELAQGTEKFGLNLKLMPGNPYEL